MTRIRHSVVTHVGRVRRINEDSVLALPDQRIWVVSDGMGGHEGGDFASQTVIEAVAAIPPDLPATERMQGLRAAILRAHDQIRAEAVRRKAGTIGATVVALLLTDHHFVAFWAGDSRLYRSRENGIELLTSDHSVVAEYVLAGRLSWDEAGRLPQSNAITRAAGVGDDPGLEKTSGEVLPGDRFLLATDGLTKYAGFETLRQVLSRAPIEDVADTLLQIALDGGGDDNVSIIVVDVR